MNRRRRLWRADRMVTPNAIVWVHEDGWRVGPKDGQIAVQRPDGTPLRFQNGDLVYFKAATKARAWVEKYVAGEAWL